MCTLNYCLHDSASNSKHTQKPHKILTPAVKCHGFFSWWRQAFTGAGTHTALSRSTSTHIFGSVLSSGRHPLSSWHPYLDIKPPYLLHVSPDPLATPAQCSQANTQFLHTCLTGTQYLQVPLNTCMDPLVTACPRLDPGLPGIWLIKPEIS